MIPRIKLFLIKKIIIIMMTTFFKHKKKRKLKKKNKKMQIKIVSGFFKTHDLIKFYIYFYLVNL